MKRRNVQVFSVLNRLNLLFNKLNRFTESLLVEQNVTDYDP